MINIDLVNILSWLFFGLIVGVVAHLIDPADVRGGVLGTVLTGIVGALLGGFLAYNLLGITVTGFSLSSFVISVIGALILAAIERLLLRSDYSGSTSEYGLKGGRSKRT